MMAGLAWCDCVRLYVPMGAPSDEVFDLTGVVLSSLERVDPEIALAWGLTRLLVDDGLAPDWTSCVKSGSKLTKTPVEFNLSAGGPVEPAEGSGSRLWVDFEILVGLARLGELDHAPEKLKRAGESLDLLKGIIEYHTDRRLGALGSFISGRL